MFNIAVGALLNANEDIESDCHTVPMAPFEKLFKSCRNDRITNDQFMISALWFP